MPAQAADTNQRRQWMAVLARASAAELESRLAAMPPLPPHVLLRGPETGLAMVRGRQGGNGAAFNLGEMTITRCSLRNRDGSIGHAYVAGRDVRQAELAAALDAALQDDAARPALLAAVVNPLAAAQQARRDAQAARAAATRVQFLTMSVMR